MAKLRLIDSELLMQIINAAKPIPPSNQNLLLSANAENNIPIVKI